MEKYTLKNRNVFEDGEYLNRFIKNVESLFRRSPYYSYYKAHLINNVNLSRCQLQSNISCDVADLEMHHVILTLYDEILTITKSFLRQGIAINSFIVLREIIDCHKNNIIPLVMLTKSNHERCHKENLIIPYESVYGDLKSFLMKYQNGITYPILYKIRDYCNKNNMSDSNIIEMINIVAGIGNWYNSIGGDNIDYISIYNYNNNCNNNIY